MRRIIRGFAGKKIYDMLTASEKKQLFLEYEKFAARHRKEYPGGWYEGVVTWEGTILVSVMSHLETFKQLYGKPMDVIWEEMPVWESPLLWLSEKTRAVPVYNSGYVKTRFEMSDAQKYSLSLLVQGEFIRDKKIVC